MMEVEASPTLSTSWPKEFSELNELDDVLKCAICYEYMQTALISACSHSFCSICIRRYLQYQNQCPTCFAELFDSQLRNNRTVDGVVQVITKVKDKLCHHLRIASVVMPSASSTGKDTIFRTPSTSSKHEELSKAQVKVEASPSKDSKTIRSKKRLDLEKPTTPKQNVPRDLDAIEVIESNVRESPRPCHVASTSSMPVSLTSPSVSKIRVPNMFTTSPKTFATSSSHVPQSTVPCPVCKVDIPESNINIHLDKCLERESGQMPVPPKIENKMKRLPKLVYSLLSDKDLKKKAKEYGLNVLGDRKALLSRLKRYTVLYNSECDKATPRSLMEILRDVEKEEKLEQKANAQAEKPTTLFSNITRSTDQKVINEANQKYIKDNNETFMALIQKMKEREGQNIRPTGHVNRIFDDVDMFEAGDSRVETVVESRDLNTTGVESTATPKRSTSSRFPSQTLNGDLLASSSKSPVVALKRFDHSTPGTSRDSTKTQLLGNEEDGDPEDDQIDRFNQSNESFSLLDESQLDFPIDPEPKPEPPAPSASIDVFEDEDSNGSIEVFVPPSRQRKRKEMASSPATSSKSFTRNLRKRVDR